MKPPSLSGETCCEQPEAVSAGEILSDKQGDVNEQGTETQSDVKGTGSHQTGLFSGGFSATLERSGW